MTGISRSIAAQTSCSFSTVINLDKVTGDFWFGFNGSGNQNFLFRSGLIYDNESNPTFSYIQNTDLLISGNIESGHLNYWINNIPLSFQTQLPLYISGFNYTWDNSIVAPSYNLQILGDAPEYLFLVPPFVSTGQNITGYVKNLKSNPNLSMRIFSGYVPNFTTTLNSIFTGIIPGGGSGSFVLSGISNIGTFNIPIQVYTNFGTINPTVIVQTTGNG